MRGDRAVPPPYEQLLAQRTALYKQLQTQGTATTTWKLEVPEELLSPRSRLAANAARRMAQGVSRGMQNLGSFLGDVGALLAGEHQLHTVPVERNTLPCTVLCLSSWSNWTDVSCTVAVIISCD